MRSFTIPSGKAELTGVEDIAGGAQVAMMSYSQVAALTTTQVRAMAASQLQQLNAGQINAIGYSGIGYKTSGVRAIPLSKKAGDPFVEADAANATSGKYPLARILYVYVNKKPNQPLSPLEAEFAKMILSKTGPEVVVKDGFVPLPAKLANDARAQLLK